MPIHLKKLFTTVESNFISLSKKLLRTSSKCYRTSAELVLLEKNCKTASTIMAALVAVLVINCVFNGLIINVLNGVSIVIGFYGASLIHTEGEAEECQCEGTGCCTSDCCALSDIESLKNAVKVYLEDKERTIEEFMKRDAETKIAAVVEYKPTPVEDKPKRTVVKDKPKATLKKRSNSNKK